MRRLSLNQVLWGWILEIFKSSTINMLLIIYLNINITKKNYNFKAWLVYELDMWCIHYIWRRQDWRFELATPKLNSKAIQGIKNSKDKGKIKRRGWDGFEINKHWVGDELSMNIHNKGCRGSQGNKWKYHWNHYGSLLMIMNLIFFNTKSLFQSMILAKTSEISLTKNKN